MLSYFFALNVFYVKMTLKLNFVKGINMRIFVYVNTNPTQRHITIHYEQSKACPHIMQQILSQNTNPTCSISDMSKNKDKSIIKLGVTANSYWLLIQVNICECNKDTIKRKLIEINSIKAMLQKDPSILDTCTMCL